MPWLKDRKWAYIRIEGREFGDVPISMELKLEVWDSPNSAGVVIDAVRCIKLALDRGISGTLEGPSAYFMKSPPIQYHDDEARELVEAYIRGEDAQSKEALQAKANGAGVAPDAPATDAPASVEANGRTEKPSKIRE